MGIEKLMHTVHDITAARAPGDFSDHVPATAINYALKSTAAFYELRAEEYFERTVSADLRELYAIFLKHVPAGGKILDAGCGSGRDLKQFSTRRFRVLGIDASQRLSMLAAEYSGAHCKTMRLQDIPYEKEFDGIWACASLLHLPKQELLPVLSLLRRALVPGGQIFASVQLGHGESLARDGRLFSYYGCEEFSQYFARADLIVEQLWISEDSLPDRTNVRWINLLAKRL